MAHDDTQTLLTINKVVRFLWCVGGKVDMFLAGMMKQWCKILAGHFSVAVINYREPPRGLELRMLNFAFLIVCIIS